MNKILFKLFFLILFLLGTYYTLFVQTEKYESSAVVTVKNLTQEQSISTLGTLLTSVSSSATQDSKILEIYIKSYDMYNILDKEFNLSDYYTSQKLDFAHRLYKKTKLPYLSKTKSNLLRIYNEDLIIFYDQISSTMRISYLHANAVTAKQVVDKIIKQSTKILNKFEHENTQIALDFLKKQAEKNKQAFMNAIKKMITYQNKHNTIDPKSDIEMEGTLLANLQSELLKKQVEYKSRLVFMKKDSPEIKSIRASIKEIKKKINSIKNRISGKKGKPLNVGAFVFEILKNEANLTKELYRQTLIKLEETKAAIGKRAKNLTVISTPEVQDMYSVPDKPKQILSIFIILGFIYGIISLIISILRSHVD